MTGSKISVEYVEHYCCRINQLEVGDCIVASGWTNPLFVYKIDKSNIYTKMGYVDNVGFIRVFGQHLVGQKSW
jgi:hypothetical protein